MRKSIPILLVPMPVRMKMEFTLYLLDHGAELPKKTAKAVERYMNDPEIMSSLEQQWFDHWWENDRQGSMASFVEHTVKDMVNLYG